MDPAQTIGALLTPAFFVYCVIIGLIVSCVRWGVEKTAQKVAKIFPDKWEGWWVWLWRENVLFAMPVVLGGLIAYLVKDYPFPEPFGTSDSARIAIGILGGIVSGWLYPRVMFYLRKVAPKKFDKNVEEAIKESDLEK